MRLRPTTLPGCHEVVAERHADARGSLVKTFQESAFRALGVTARFVEDFHTVSGRGVLRGLHLQLPPAAHHKIVYVISGEIFDVLLDLRPGSPSYRRHETFRLGADEPRMLHVAPGVAHGFCVLGEGAVVGYKVSAEHSPAHEGGVRWDSAGIGWPVTRPVLSPRDAALPPLDAFGVFEWPR